MSETTRTGNFEIIGIDEQLHLRQMQQEDSGVLFSLVDNNREYLGRWLPWVQETNEPADTAAFIAKTLEARQNGSAYEYGIILGGEVVGHISLMHVTDEYTPEIGYWISSEKSGQGITARAAQAISDFGFNVLGLNKIVIKAEPDNLGSNKIAEKLGYTIESTEIDERMGRPVNVWVKSN